MESIRAPRLTAQRAVLAGLVLVLSMTTTPVAAFGSDGHRIIAELAQRQLTPTARDAVAALLDGEAAPDLVGVATWADDIRELDAWRWTAPLHYVNFPRGECRYHARRQCPGGRCVVGAIERYAAILGDQRATADQRQQALKFLVHFVGDVHQPLHAGYGDDRGGNTFQVFYLGRGSNLHALWDGGILRLARLDWPDHAERLAQRSLPVQADWSPQAPARWAEQSCRLISDAHLYPAKPGRLPAGYRARQLPVVEGQLIRAGARLAAVLNAVLDGSP